MDGGMTLLHLVSQTKWVYNPRSTKNSQPAFFRATSVGQNGNQDLGEVWNPEIKLSLPLHDASWPDWAVTLGLLILECTKITQVELRNSRARGLSASVPDRLSQAVNSTELWLLIRPRHRNHNWVIYWQTSGDIASRARGMQMSGEMPAEYH